jgi:hypothetical protein
MKLNAQKYCDKKDDFREAVSVAIANSVFSGMIQFNYGLFAESELSNVFP